MAKFRTPEKLAVVERALAEMSPEAREAFEPLLPAWVLRKRRLDARDSAVREALALLGDLAPTAGQQFLAAELARAARDWLPFQRGEHNDQFGRTVSDILRLNSGSPLGMRQIANIAAGTRTGT